jgi:peptidyl-prolyl cis-trans isomerase C
MRTRPLLVALASFVALSLLPLARSHAGMSAEEQARRAQTVAHVGTFAISVGELEDRLAQVPHFQLKAFGETPDEIRHKFFDQILLPEILYSLAADKNHLEREVATDNKLTRALSAAAMKASMTGIRSRESIPVSEIERYYEENKIKYDTPARLYLYRILCKSPEEAHIVLEEATREPTLEHFTKLAQEHSIDKATNLRGGNLGYLTPDGLSSEAGVTVDPAIVKAAAPLKDGEFVPQPVPEKTAPSGTAYAVVWRRGSVPESHRTVREAATQIREAIWKEEADAVAKKHLEELRKAHLIELNEALLNGIEITSNEGEVVTRRRPGEVLPLGQGARGVPHPVNQ